MSEPSFLVISDIDGTLIPNPYYCKISPKQHARLCLDLMKLLTGNPRMWLATGRTFQTYSSLLQTFGGAVAYPEIFIGEFGCDIYKQGASHLSLPQDPVLMECERIFTDLLVEMGYPEDLSDGEQGLHGVCLETKRRIMHVDWDLGSDGEDRRFLREFPERIRSVPEVRGLSVRVFENLRRIDLCSPDFIPKVSVWETLGGQLLGKEQIWILGDDAYDREMFAAIKKTAPAATVKFGSANPDIPADAYFSCGSGAMDFAQNLFEAQRR